MSIARALYERFQLLIHEFAKFGVIGVVGLFITNGGYALLHNHFRVGPVTSTTAATAAATIVAYLGNRYWSFRHRERTTVLRESVLFFVLNGIGLLIQDAAVAFNFYALGLGHNKVAQFVALNAGIGIATLFRFWSYRKWVWAAGPGSGQPRAVAGQVPAGPGGDGHATAAPAAPVIRHANGHSVAGPSPVLDGDRARSVRR